MASEREREEIYANFVDFDVDNVSHYLRIKPTQMHRYYGDKTNNNRIY